MRREEGTSMQGLKITSKVLSFIIIINKIQWKIDVQNTSITLATRHTNIQKAVCICCNASRVTLHSN